jgi:porphobilinogen deaminase
MASTYGREKLNDLGYKTEIVAVKAQGILFLTNLFMNSESLEFYKNIGYAMINGQVDIAVHSMKDVPTCRYCSSCSSGKSNNPRYISTRNVDFLN